jgi:hypothetical protein
MLELLLANVNVMSREYAAGQLLGLFTATVVVGLWPLLAGISKGRWLIGLAGFCACIAGGFRFGCFGSVPAAILFHALIGATKPRGGDDRPPPPFNPYANGKRSAF